MNAICVSLARKGGRTWSTTQQAVGAENCLGLAEGAETKRGFKRSSSGASPAQKVSTVRPSVRARFLLLALQLQAEYFQNA